MKKIKVFISVMLLVMVCFVCSSCGEEKYESHTVEGVEFSLPESYLDDDDDKGENWKYASYSQEGEIFEVNVIDYSKGDSVKASTQVGAAIEVSKEGLTDVKESKVEINGKKYISITGSSDNTEKEKYDKTETATAQKEAFVFIPNGYTLIVVNYIYTDVVDEELAKEHKQKIFNSISFEGAEK